MNSCEFLNTFSARRFSIRVLFCRRRRLFPCSFSSFFSLGHFLFDRKFSKKKSPGKTHTKKRPQSAKEEGCFDEHREGRGRDLRRCDSVWASVFDLVTREAVVFRVRA